MEKKIAVLIATHSIPLADGLHALLKAIPQIDEVNITRDMENTLQQLEAGQPRIVLIDSVLLGREPQVLLEKIASLVPETQRVLLVDDVRKTGWVPQYGEIVLMKGVSPSAVVTLVTNLLFPKGEEHEHNHSDI